MKTKAYAEPEVMRSDEPTDGGMTVQATFLCSEELQFHLDGDRNLVVTAQMAALPPINFPMFSTDMTTYMHDNGLSDVTMDLMYRAVEHAMRQGALLTLFMGQLEK